jgi:hypothetical protein
MATRVYVSGPMTGIPHHNFPAFHAATAALRAAGYEPVDPSVHGADPSKTWTDFLRRDLLDLLSCEAVALLAGWESSRGANLEVYVAKSLEMPVRTVDEWVSESIRSRAS